MQIRDKNGTVWRTGVNEGEKYYVAKAHYLPGVFVSFHPPGLHFLMNAGRSFPRGLPIAAGTVEEMNTLCGGLYRKMSQQAKLFDIESELGAIRSGRIG